MSAGGDLDGRQEVTGQPIGHPLELRLAAPGLRDEPDNLAKRGVAADLLGVNLDHTELVERAREDLVGGPLVHRDRLAGERRLIDRRAPCQNRPIDRNPLAGPDDHQLSHGDVAGGNLDLHAVAPHPRRARSLIDERAAPPAWSGRT